MEMLVFDRFQVILPTLYYRRRSHAWYGSDDHLFPLVRLDDIMAVSCAKDSLTDWHYHWYDSTSWCRTPLYRECEYKGDFLGRLLLSPLSKLCSLGAPIASELPSNGDGIASGCQWKVTHPRWNRFLDMLLKSRLTA